MTRSHSFTKDYRYIYILTASIFFIAGILSVLAYQDYQNKNIQAVSSSDYVSSTPTSTPPPTITPISQIYKEHIINQKTPQTAPSGKFTIVESKKITADSTAAETGETVNYTVTLKNTGSKKKFLTHICFNHSGGETFGCLLNHNLFPDKEINLNNSMMYKTAGTYSVWVTWSQDGTNFYRPVGAGKAVVRIQ